MIYHLRLHILLNKLGLCAPLRLPENTLITHVAKADDINIEYTATTTW